MTDPTTCARGCKVPGAHAIQHAPDVACPGCQPRTAIRGLTVCVRCANLFRGALTDLATRWTALQTSVARPAGGGNTAGRVHTSTISTAEDQWRPAVTQAIVDVAEWIEFLDRVIEPLDGIPSLTALGKRQALAVLAFNHRLVLIRNPALAEAFVGKALRLRDRAFGALSTGYVRRVPLKNPAAKCICLVEHDDPTTEAGFTTERCNGDLVAVLQPDDRARSSAILCSRFPTEHAVPTTSWAALADELAAAVQ